jgi:hypothetical protein
MGADKQYCNRSLDLQRHEYAVIRLAAKLTCGGLARLFEAKRPACHCEERKARRGNLYQTHERPALSSLIPNALPYVIRFAAKIRRNSARLLIPSQVIARSERSERRSNLYTKRRVSCFVEIAASRFRAPRNDFPCLYSTRFARSRGYLRFAFCRSMWYTIKNARRNVQF